MKTILFQGDSITDALRDRSPNGHLGIGYARMVAAELGFQYPNEYQFFNRGIGGNRIVDMYARIKSDAINLKPDIMSILIGINDVWHELGQNNGTSPEKFFTIYCMLIEELKEALPDLKIMILEPFVLKGISTESSWKKFRLETDKMIEKARAVAEKYDLKYISLQDKFDEACKLAPEACWLFDGVHPSAAGHELIKREWLKAFNEL